MAGTTTASKVASLATIALSNRLPSRSSLITCSSVDRPPLNRWRRLTAVSSVGSVLAPKNRCVNIEVRSSTETWPALKSPVPVAHVPALTATNTLTICSRSRIIYKRRIRSFFRAAPSAATRSPSNSSFQLTSNLFKCFKIKLINSFCFRLDVVIAA